MNKLTSPMTDISASEKISKNHQVDQRHLFFQTNLLLECRYRSYPCRRVRSRICCCCRWSTISCRQIIGCCKRYWFSHRRILFRKSEAERNWFILASLHFPEVAQNAKKISRISMKSRAHHRSRRRESDMFMKKWARAGKLFNSIRLMLRKMRQYLRTPLSRGRDGSDCRRTDSTGGDQNSGSSLKWHDFLFFIRPEINYGL